MPDKKALEEGGLRLQGRKDDTTATNVKDSVKTKQSAPQQQPPPPVAKAQEKEAHRTSAPQGTDDEKPAARTPQAQSAQDKADKFNGFVAYNGSECEKYRWAQTIDDVTLYVDLGGARASKEIACSATKTTVSVLRPS
jgi:hypothetical protein